MRGRSIRGQNCNRSVAHRRQALSEFVGDDEWGPRAFYRDMSMAFFLRGRAFPHHEARELAADLRNGRQAQCLRMAASSTSTQLPGDHGDLAKSRSCGRKTSFPSRNAGARRPHGRQPQSCPRRRRPAPQAQPTPPAAAPAAGRAADRDRSICNRHGWCRTREIRREGGGQLGDLLFSKPGITGFELRSPALQVGRSSGVLDVNRVGIFRKTAQPAAERPISARIISCQSIRWRQTRSK